MCLGLAFTPELAALVLQTPVVTDWLGFFVGSFAALTPTLFQEVLQHFSPTSLNITGCRLRASEVVGRLIGAISENRLDGGSSCMMDDAITDFILQEDVHSGDEGDASTDRPFGELKSSEGSITKDLFKRLVEVCR